MFAKQAKRGGYEAYVVGGCVRDSLLGITPNDFLRSVRLKRAAQLLATTTLPITEVAMQTGFNTPRYFSTHFKNMFGVLPSEYRDGKKTSPR